MLSKIKIPNSKVKIIWMVIGKMDLDNKKARNLIKETYFFFAAFLWKQKK